jgi:hypothetical protein
MNIVELAKRIITFDSFHSVGIDHTYMLHVGFLRLLPGTRVLFASEAPWFWKDPQTAIGVSDKNIQLTEASVILHKLHRPGGDHHI